MMVTDSERERVIRELRERYAADSLTDEEFDRRLSVALNAQSRAELVEALPRGEALEHGEAPVLEKRVRPHDLQSVERHLSAEEWIAWVGRPDPAKHLTRGDIYLIPFSIFWGGFAIVWEVLALSGRSGGFGVFGVPFVLIGLYFMIGRFFYKAYRRRRTIYALTNRRVMRIIDRRQGEALETRYLRALSNISTNVNPDGHGSVEFDNTGPLPGWYGDTGMELFAGGRVPTGLSFFDIEDPRGVSNLVERVRERDRS